MPLGARFRRLELVEDGLGCDVPGDLLQVGVGFGFDPDPVSDPDTSVTSLVISCSASRLICRSRSARFARRRGQRFWLIKTKVERKIASVEQAGRRVVLFPGDIADQQHCTSIVERAVSDR